MTVNQADRPAHCLDRQQDNGNSCAPVVQRQRIKQSNPLGDQIGIPKEIAANHQREDTKAPVDVSWCLLDCFGWCDVQKLRTAWRYRS